MSGIGEISAIYSIITGSIDVVRAAIDIYGAVQDKTGVPKRIRVVAEQLFPVEGLLNDAETQYNRGGLEDSTWQKAIPALEKCREYCTDIKNIIEESCPRAEAGKFGRVWKAGSTMASGRGRKAGELIKAVYDHLETLQHRHIITNLTLLQDIKSGLDDLPDDENGRYQHLGTGDQNVIEGYGNIYKQTGAGKQFNNTTISTFNESQQVHNSSVTMNNVLSLFASSIALDQAPGARLEPKESRSIKINALPQRSLPYPENPNFVGRSDILRTMETCLLDDDTKARPESAVAAFAVWGAPGQGKTQTALKFAFKHRERFSSILWVFADREQKLLEGFSEYAVSLGLVESSTDLTDGARALLRWYEATDEQWLLIYDNAVDTKLINDYWPHGKTGAVLITSRYHTFATSLVAGSGQELSALEEDAAVQMVLSQCPSEALFSLDEEQKRLEALKIAKRVGCLPLGIQASIGLVIEENCSLADYNRNFNTAHDILEEASEELSTRRFAPYPGALKDVYLDSFQNLEKDEQSLLQIIALLDPDKIQETLFQRSKLNADVHHAGFMFKFRRCLKTLWRGRIAKNERTEENELPSFHVHRLLQACVQIEMSPEDRQKAFESAICLVSAVLGSKLDPTWPEVRREFKEFFPHVQALHDFYLSLDSGALQAPITFVEVTRKAAWLCYKRNFFDHGLKLLGTVDHLFPKGGEVALSEKNHQVVAARIATHHLHACFATEIGNFNLSLTHFTSGLELFKGALAAGFPQDASPEFSSLREQSLYGGVGNSLNGLGRDAEAETAYLEALKLRDPEEVTELYEINLCRSWWSRGLLDKAGDRLTGIIEEREAVYGPDDTEEYYCGHALYVLGNVRIDEGKLDEAYSLHKRALKCWRATYGEEHHKTGDAWHKLGWHQARTAEYEDAKASLQRALLVYSSGSDILFRGGEIARTSYKLSLVLKELNLPVESQKHFDMAEKLKQDLRPSRNAGGADETMYNSLVSLWAR